MPQRRPEQQHFAPPTLETVVVPSSSDDKGALHIALAQLAEQDPLINVRQDEMRHEIAVSLYGVVQKEVIQATLASDYGMDVDFRETTTICVERPIAVGPVVEGIRDVRNPFLATLGFRIERAAVGSGVLFGLEVELGGLPLAFHRAVEETVRETLQQGLYGWQVTDCTVTMTHSGFAPTSSAGDFRNLTPLVLMRALKQARTTTCEPIHRFYLEIPAETLGPVLPLLARLDAVPKTQGVRGPWCTIEGDVPAARIHQLRLELPAFTRGEAAFESSFERYRPVSGTIPTRPRWDHNPLNRKEYLLRVAGRVKDRGDARGRS